MKTSNEIIEEVKNILKTQWTKRDGQKVPEAEDITLSGNDAVLLDGTVLYADINDSTGLVDGYKNWFAAEVYKTYLSASSHIIKNNSGVITAYDGDRVMAVFIGNSKNSQAAKAALQISYIVKEINSAIKKQYPNTSFKLKHSIGIDTSPLFIARTGIRNTNDLVWVGRSANYAAKLCSLASSNYSIFITSSVYEKLNEGSKFGGSPRRDMWEKTIWDEKGISIYQTNWQWSF